MRVPERHLHFSHLIDYQGPVDKIAAAYNRTGNDYAAYADGDTTQLFAFEGMHAYADRRLWALLAGKLENLRATGASTVSILDAGCGPGTWLRRLVTYARLLGFSTITARGFDVAEAQIQIAWQKAADLAELPGVTLRFDVADLGDRLPEACASVDVTLCLYSVLSHLPVASISTIAAEIARVTKGHFIATVRSSGSTPTICVDSIEKARRFKLDHERNRIEVELDNGSHIAFGLHLFTAREMRNHFRPHFDVEDLCGLDIFHSRFAPDVRWNPASLVDEQISDPLVQLEETFARNPSFMERAAHLLFVGRPRQMAPR
jgi:SAM-dependent methyltransferase